MNDKGRPEFACILSFMVNARPEVDLAADQYNVRIFKSEIIYHLKEQFEDYMEEVHDTNVEKSDVVWPCELEILPDFIIRKTNPIILGCRVLRGSLRMGTPLTWQRLDAHGRPDPLHIGTVDSIQEEKKDIDRADE